jgi:flagellar motor switch protein FliM
LIWALKQGGKTVSKGLEQSEIDALFSRARELQAAATKGQKKVVPYDPRRSNQLSEDQLAAVTTLHEGFARRVSNSLGAQVRSAFELRLVTVEQLAYREFLARTPDLTYFASLHVMPIDARAAVQLDIALAYPIIEAILGGSPSEPMEPRDLTEVEEQILETALLLIVQDLHNAWAPVLDLDFQFEQRQRSVQMQSTMHLGEKVLCLTFEARLLDTSANLALVFPAVVSNTLLRRLSAQWTNMERIPSRHTRRRLREHITDGRFVADLSLPPCFLPIRQLVGLEPGKILTLPKRAHDPIHLNVAGKPMFLAYPVRHGANRAAKVVRRLSLLASSNAKEAES